MHEFFYLGSGTALAADWYVVSGDTGNQIKYYQTTTSYAQTNWSSAITSADSLNTFLNDAVQSGDTVYIKEGTYNLSVEINLENKLLHLFGGFTGTETNLSYRKLDTNITTLNANANEDNRRRVFKITTDSTIDSFTIMGGNVNGTGNQDGGGGICIWSDNPTITNCTITGNASYFVS